MPNKNKEQAAKTRKAILDASIPVFLEYGFARARLQDIAERANVTRGACYWHFKNKAKILLELMEEELDPVFETTVVIADMNISPRKKLKKIFTSFMNNMVKDNRLRSILQIATSRIEYTDDIAEYFSIIAKKDLNNVTLITKIYEEGVASGDFGTCNPKVSAMAFASYITGLIHSMANYSELLNFEEHIEELAVVILPPEA